MRCYIYGYKINVLPLLQQQWLPGNTQIQQQAFYLLVWCSTVREGKSRARGANVTTSPFYFRVGEDATFLYLRSVATADKMQSQ